MGGHQQPTDPAGYSTQIDGDYSTGYHSTGYKKIIISPQELEDSISQYRKKLEHKSTAELSDTLLTAVLDETAFGQIPNAGHAQQQVSDFVSSHAAHMAKMGNLLADFIARVQAAAQLGYDADPVTRQRAAYARAHMNDRRLAQ